MNMRQYTEQRSVVEAEKSSPGTMTSKIDLAGRSIVGALLIHASSSPPAATGEHIVKTYWVRLPDELAFGGGGGVVEVVDSGRSSLRAVFETLYGKQERRNCSAINRQVKRS
jgi:hypothetical protein